MTAEPTLLRFEGIVKKFGPTTVLHGIDMDVRAGEVVALLGENGAGKSTLIKTLAGLYQPDGGRILLRGQPFQNRPPRHGERQPVAFIHQDLGLIDWMTVAENMTMGRGFPRRGLLIDWRTAHRYAADALAEIGCDIHPGRRVSELTRTEKSLVAIARALAVSCDCLVLDEPTASLPADEVERLFTALRPLRARGVGIIYVSHRLDEIYRIADRVVVLRDGCVVGNRGVAETTPSELVQMIVGRTPDRLFHRATPDLGPEALSVVDLHTADAGPVSFSVRQGEMVGLVGLRGAGQEQVGRAIFGCEPYEGVLVLDGLAYHPSTPHEAVRRGVGMIAGERAGQSVAISLSIRENLFLNPPAADHDLFQPLMPKQEHGRVKIIGGELGLRPNDPELAIEALSGGNQQKVVVGRWLQTGRRLLLAEDPTNGVDVGAKAEIYRLLAVALQRGLAVVVISTDFEEVAQICHRALVFSRGRIVDELAGSALTTAALIHAASAREAA